MPHTPCGMGMMGYADSDHGHGILKDRRSTICLDNEKGNHTMSIGQSVSKHRFCLCHGGMRDRRSLRVVRAGRRPFHLVRRGVYAHCGEPAIRPNDGSAEGRRASAALLSAAAHVDFGVRLGCHGIACDELRVLRVDCSDVDGSAPFHGRRAPCPVGFAVCGVRAADASVRV